MIEPTLLFGTIFSTASAAIYAYIGLSLGRRQIISPEARTAWGLFVVWWYALAAITLAGGLVSLLGAWGFTDLPVFLTFTEVSLLAICVALCGLMYYLTYLFTGNSKLLAPLMVLYAIYYILLLYYVNLSVPVGVLIGRWSATLRYQQQPTGPLVLAFLLFLIFPPVLGGLAYFTLYFRVRELTQKYRIILVSTSIVFWFTSSFFASAAGLNQSDLWQILSRLIGLGATLMILAAYKPPMWIKARWGISSIADDGA